MEMAELLLHKLAEKRGSGKALLIGICGRAGSGKTTLSGRIAALLAEEGIASVAYSGDWRFIRDSCSRKRWLEEKWRSGIDAYMYAINQYTWWDFAQIQVDLERIARGDELVICDGYNRQSGAMDLRITIPADAARVILYENSILGGVELVNLCDQVILVNTPDALCFTRLLSKDEGRRTVPEIATRFLITTYSENIFFNQLLDHFTAKILICDSEGRFGAYPDLREITHIPVPLSHPLPMPPCKGTIFCDLDGTLIKHVPVPSEDGAEIEILPGSSEKLREFRARGYYIILTTSRSYAKTFTILEKLKAEGLEFDQVICDLPIGPRYLINDSKGDECRAFAFALVRDQGIGGIALS